jgi:hypothetical protein
MTIQVTPADFASPTPGRLKAGETPVGGRVPCAACAGLS